VKSGFKRSKLLILSYFLYITSFDKLFNRNIGFSTYFAYIPYPKEWIYKWVMLREALLTLLEPDKRPLIRSSLFKNDILPKL